MQLEADYHVHKSITVCTLNRMEIHQTDVHHKNVLLRKTKNMEVSGSGLLKSRTIHSWSSKLPWYYTKTKYSPAKQYNENVLANNSTNIHLPQTKNKKDNNVWFVLCWVTKITCHMPVSTIYYVKRDYHVSKTHNINSHIYTEASKELLLY